MPAPSHPSPRRRGPHVGGLRRLLALAALVTVLAAPLLGARPADAVATPQSDAAASWLAGLVGPDGAVANPNSGAPSVSGTVQVALALVANQSDRDAIARAVAYVSSRVDEYVTAGGADSPGRLGYLIVLATATGADPRAFGSTGTDLVARLGATYETAEPGFFGTPDPYNAVFNQSLAVVGLVAAGAPVPAGATAWLAAQQCGVGNSSEGGWVGYRAVVGGALEPCPESSGTAYTGADSNDTAIAVQALVAAGADGPVPAALEFLRRTQSPATGGFGYYAGDVDADPNSTALGIQALVATGNDPTTGGWTVPGGSPYSSLVGWQITSGPDAGALASPYSSGAADLLATFQGAWGLARQPLPFPALPDPAPSTTTTTAAGPTSTAPPTPPAPAPGGGVGPVRVTPGFTG